MNRDEAKNILLLYRHGTADAEDPQIAEALALAESDPELKDWLVIHCAREFVLREKIRQLAAPAGLKEQIISEQAANERMNLRRNKMAVAVAALMMLVALSSFWFLHRPADDTLAVYQNQMAGVALRGYAMDKLTDDPAAIRAYLAQNAAPADFGFTAAQQRATLTGCAVQGWQGVKVAMICFRTRQASPEVTSDLWLFVVKKNSVKQSSLGKIPQLSKINRLTTATWVDGDDLFFLGTVGDAQALQPYL